LYLKVDEFPLEREGMLLGVYLIARGTNPAQLQDALRKHRARAPNSFPSALVRASEGLAEKDGPAAALNLLSAARGADFKTGHDTPVLLAFIRLAHQADAAKQADDALTNALAVAPDSADLHAARGLHLELGGVSKHEIQSAYFRALELDPKHANALEGLGRSSLSEEPEQALHWFEQALQAAPQAEAPSLGLARALIAVQRPDEAVQQLDTVLDINPLSAEAAGQRASLDLARDTLTPRSLSLAQRAAQIGRRPEDFDRLSEVFSKLGQPERAASATDYAQTLRASLSTATPE
jgi:Tfp pilus assembly protein PilF